MKDCPEGKVRNPATNRCIKVKAPKAPKEPKEPKAPKEPKKDEYIYKYEGVEYDNLTDEEKNLKKKLPSFIPDRFIYNIDVFLNDLKDGNYSYNTILHTLKTILNDLEDINNEVISDKETRTPKQQLKFNPFIKYNNDRINKVNDYKKYVIDKKNKPKRPISPVFDILDDVSPPIKRKPKAKKKRPISPVFDMLDDVSPIKPKRKIKSKRPISPVFDMLDDVSPIKPKRKIKPAVEDNAPIAPDARRASAIAQIAQIAKKKLIKSNISSKFKLFKVNKASILDRINFYIYIKSLYLKVKDKLKYCDSDDIVLEKTIGSPSVFGDIYLAHFKGKLGEFAIKTIKRAKYIQPFIDVEVKLQDLLTKYVIDFKSIHFPITYGTLYCPKPKRIYQLNELADGDMKQLVNSYVKDYEESMFSKISRKSELKNRGKIILNCFGQCLISALMFNTYTDHLHNDTHFGNFLYHTVDKGGYFHYKYKDKDYYLENLGYIMVIWDFGLAKPFSDRRFHIFRDIEYIMNSIILYYQKFIKDTSELNKYIVSLRSMTDNLDYDDYYIVIHTALMFLIKIDCLSTKKPDNIINKNPFYIIPTSPIKFKTKSKRLISPGSPVYDMIDDFSVSM